MLTQNTINHYAVSRRGTDESVIIEGYHALKHALRFGATIIDLYATVDAVKREYSETVRDDTLTDVLRERATHLSHEDLLRLAPDAGRTGIIARAQKPAPPQTEAFTENASSPLVILEDPRDLDNIGACIRVAAARGCRGVLVTGQSNPWHARCIRAAAGCQWALPVGKITDRELKTLISSHLIYACSDEGTSIYDTTPPDDAIYVFGTERDGLSPSVRQDAAHIVSLPMRSGVSSLNLATSVSGILYAAKH